LSLDLLLVTLVLLGLAYFSTDSQ